MSRPDWFRNTEWTAEIERNFHAKLRRARKANKPQYLRIQALTLASSHPRVALELLDMFFALGEHFDTAIGYECQAEVFLTLKDEVRAIAAYEKALAREKAFPNAKGQSAIDLPLLIATGHRLDLYPRALELLSDDARCLFPIQKFKHAAALALIAADIGKREEAALYSTRALEIADAQDSDLRYHPDLGLVGDEHAELRNTLRELTSL